VVEEEEEEEEEEEVEGETGMLLKLILDGFAEV
jgi:hypothetical protein